MFRGFDLPKFTMMALFQDTRLVDRLDITIVAP